MTDWAHGLMCEVEIRDGSGTPSDTSKAHIAGVPEWNGICDSLDENGEMEQQWVLTVDAEGGEEYTMAIHVHCDAEENDMYATSKKTKLYGIDLAPLPQALIGLESGKTRNALTFTVTKRPPTYDPGENAVVKVNDPPGEPNYTWLLPITFQGEHGTAELPAMENAVPETYQVQAWLHYPDDEKKTASHARSLQMAALDLVSPTDSAKVVPINSSIDFRAELDPDDLAGGSWAWIQDGDNLGSFVPNGLEATFNATASGKAMLYARYVKDGGIIDSRKVEVTAVKVLKIQYRRGTGDYEDLPAVLKVRQKESLDFKAVIAPEGASWPSSKPVWGGTAGATGTGETKSVTFGVASSTDTDHKTVTVECGNTVTAKALVCRYVLGAHSNVGAGVELLAGHAWISVTDFGPSSPATATWGLYPDGVAGAPDNGDGTDVRANMELTDYCAHKRFFLLKPSQKQALDQYVSVVRHWTMTFTCASFAHDAVYTAVGVDIDADDILGFETPREFGIHIQELEDTDPTSALNPTGGGGGSGSANSFEGSCHDN